MRVEFMRGKRFTKGFMPFATVVEPGKQDFLSRYERLIPQNHKDRKWYWTAKSLGETMRLNRRTNSLKAIKRWIKNQDFERGTFVIVDNWYVGYANVIITV